MNFCKSFCNIPLVLTHALSLLKDGQVCLLPIIANFRKISLTSLIMRHLAGIIGRLRKGQSLVVAAEVGS